MDWTHVVQGGRLPRGGYWLVLRNKDGFGGVVSDVDFKKTGFRYTCEQNEDIHGYGWNEFDARHGGVQTIHDTGNKIDLTTTFVKIPGGEHGGSWAARIKGELRPDAAKDTNTMLFYYIAQEGSGELEVVGDSDKFGFNGDVKLKGNSKSLGDYTMTISKGEGTMPTTDHALSDLRHGDTTLVQSLELNDNELWQPKASLFKALQSQALYVKDNFDLDNPPPPWQVYRMENNPGKGNGHIIQKNFQGSFEFEIIFSSGSAVEPVTSKEVSAYVDGTREFFADRFSKIFNLKAPYTGEKFVEFGKAMFSNLIGGVGYFYGHQVIDRSDADEYREDDENFWEAAAEARARNMQALEGPYELFTSIPSRPFFPRGFLWDEGYHLIPIADWDMDLTLEIIKSWYETMDEDGWIPREQILGMEARSKVPNEFQIQYPHYANPPTLFLVIEGFMERLRKGNGTARNDKEHSSRDQTLHTAHLDNIELGENYLRNIYPLLQRQYQWFRRTQRGDVKTYDREAFSTREAYRWKGRTEKHCLTSGLDDYPRPSPPSLAELHVDLISWVGLMTKSLINIADALGIPEDVADLQKNLEAIEHNVNDLHWSDKEGCYCDATVDDFEEHTLVCHKGYISIFPFMVGLMKPNDPKLGKILELIGDEEELFSPYGIRSLSKKDEFYGTDENYWRSPVWMPMNYMIVKQLHVSDTTSYRATHYVLLTTSLLSTLPRRAVLTAKRPASCTFACARTSSTPSSRAGRKRASRGSSTTRRRARDSATSTLRAGRVWWSRLWPWMTWRVERDRMTSCKCRVYIIEHL